MIIITVDNIPVACYDDVSPLEALSAYINEFLGFADIHDILTDKEESASFEWKGRKYDAIMYLESF